MAAERSGIWTGGAALTGTDLLYFPPAAGEGEKEKLFFSCCRRKTQLIGSSKCRPCRPPVQVWQGGCTSLLEHEDGTCLPPNTLTPVSDLEPLQIKTGKLYVLDLCFCLWAFSSSSHFSSRFHQIIIHFMWPFWRCSVYHYPRFKCIGIRQFILKTTQDFTCNLKWLMQ